MAASDIQTEFNEAHVAYMKYFRSNIGMYIVVNVVNFKDEVMSMRKLLKSHESATRKEWARQMGLIKEKIRCEKPAEMENLEALENRLKVFNEKLAGLGDFRFRPIDVLLDEDISYIVRDVY